MIVRTEEELDQIFAAFQDDRVAEAPRPLAAWLSEHPDLSSQFVLWATELPALAAADLLPPSPQFEARGRAIGQKVLERIGLTVEAPALLSSLNDAARQAGKRPRELAQALGIRDVTVRQAQPASDRGGYHPGTVGRAPCRGAECRPRRTSRLPRTAADPCGGRRIPVRAGSRSMRRAGFRRGGAKLLRYDGGTKRRMELACPHPRRLQAGTPPLPEFPHCQPDGTRRARGRS